MKKFINLLKFIVPIFVFSFGFTAFAVINTAVLEGTCGGRNTELSGSGIGEIHLDGNKVSEANGVWSFKSDIKSGSHNVSVGVDSLDFSIPKCPEGGGIIQQGSCLGLFGKFADSCYRQNIGVRFIPAGTGVCPVWMFGGCITNEPTAEEKANQKLIESLQAQIVELISQIAKLLVSRR